MKESIRCHWGWKRPYLGLPKQICSHFVFLEPLNDYSRKPLLQEPFHKDDCQPGSSSFQGTSHLMKVRCQSHSCLWQSVDRRLIPEPSHIHTQTAEADKAALDHWGLNSSLPFLLGGLVLFIRNLCSWGRIHTSPFSILAELKGKERSYHTSCSDWASALDLHETPVYFHKMR